jgi:hypothetical protein
LGERRIEERKRPTQDLHRSEEPPSPSPSPGDGDSSMGPRAAQKSGKHPDRNRDCSAPTGRTPPCTELLKNELYKVRMEAWRDDSSFGTVLPPTRSFLDAFHTSTLTMSTASRPRPAT